MFASLSAGPDDMYEVGMQDVKDDPRLQGAPRERTGVVARSQLLGHLVSSSASCIFLL